MAKRKEYPKFQAAGELPIQMKASEGCFISEVTFSQDEKLGAYIATWIERPPVQVDSEGRLLLSSDDPKLAMLLALCPKIIKWLDALIDPDQIYVAWDYDFRVAYDALTRKGEVSG